MQRYFERRLFLPFIDFLTSLLDLRFPPDTDIPAIHLQQLLSQHAKPDSLEKVMRAAASYEHDVNLPKAVVRAQVSTWMGMVCRGEMEDEPSLRQCIQRADAESLPAVSFLALSLWYGSHDDCYGGAIFHLPQKAQDVPAIHDGR